jgi:O-antigen/teichoic acid export membrane protein
VWLVALTWPLFFLVAVAAPLFLDWLGPGYHAGRTATLLLAAAMLVGSAAGLVDIVVITLGKTRWNLADTAASLTINVTLNLILIPRLGITGAALAWAVSIAAANVIALIQVGRGFRLLPFSGLGTLIAILAGVCFGGLPAAATAIFGLNAPALVAAAALGSAVYLPTLYRLRRELHLDLVLRRPPPPGSDAAAPAMQRREDALAGDQA